MRYLSIRAFKMNNLPNLFVNSSRKKVPFVIKGVILGEPIVNLQIGDIVEFLNYKALIIDNYERGSKQYLFLLAKVNGFEGIVLLSDLHWYDLDRNFGCAIDNADPYFESYTPIGNVFIVDKLLSVRLPVFDRNGERKIDSNGNWQTRVARKPHLSLYK